MIAWKDSIENCQWLLFVFVCRLLNIAKYVVCFYNCWKPSLGVFYTGGVLRGFDRFMEKAPAVGFLFKQSFDRDFEPGVFFHRFCWIFGSTCLVEHKWLLLYCFGTTIIINILSSICRTNGMQGFFYMIFLLLLFASDDIKYFFLKSKFHFSHLKVLYIELFDPYLYYEKLHCFWIFLLQCCNVHWFDRLIQNSKSVAIVLYAWHRL